ncbi:MAG: T9SS type A sorting domain-containing protein [Bacteroidetes bacterium]|nr:T9SS type A sorting domain-containing protein [Bacteroidota bacterium]
MKTKITILFMLLSISVLGQNWTLYGPAGIHANNILFGAGNNYNTVICTDSGVCVDNGVGATWNTANYGLPVWDAVPYDANHVLVGMGDGSWSDGVYSFDLSNNTYSVMEWFAFTTFLKYCTSNNTYYAGTRYNGLYSSTDGITWDTVPYFQGKGCTAMDFFGQHIVVTQETNIFATYYSDDGGVSWNQSPSNIPIHDLAFKANGLLYGVFTGISNSSGLYLSSDFGHTWGFEYFVDNMNTVGYDVVGNIFTGFHGALPTFEGVAIYDTAVGDFTFLNNNLPNKNINMFNFNPILSSITIFACTDTGVYFCNDYSTAIKEYSASNATMSVYPNPASGRITVEFENPDSEPFRLAVYDIHGKIVYSQENITTSKTVLDAGIFAAGTFFCELTNLKTQNRCRRKLCAIK